MNGASGFVRRGGPRAGKVSLVIGGGSGHYPSYSGVVGAGFADGAVLGDVFASPSTEQVYRICQGRQRWGRGRAVASATTRATGSTSAPPQDRLVAEGIDTRIVYVTDDIASAGPRSQDKRRGIAGTFTVYKIAGAAADSGESTWTRSSG